MLKKVAIALVIIAAIAYWATPYVIQSQGKITTRILVYNGNDEAATYKFNGTSRELQPGETDVLVTSRLRNRVRFDHPERPFKARFRTGQFIVNLGHYPIRVEEVRFAWDEATQEFQPWKIERRDQLLYQSEVAAGSILALDNCWDCCLILPPGERPFKYLTKENADRRMFLTHAQ